jgi:rubrerythrin
MPITLDIGRQRYEDNEFISNSKTCLELIHSLKSKRNERYLDLEGRHKTVYVCRSCDYLCRKPQTKKKPSWN